MKTRINVNQPKKTFSTTPSSQILSVGMFGAVAGVLLATGTAPAAGFTSPVGAVFVIAMENHNFTQPTNQTSPQPVFGNPAAPFINSLLTPGNPNAAQVSYATAYLNAGFHVHPSEPSYVWAEAGTDFGVHTDADPRPSNNNTFYDESVHLTALLNAAGIPWKNYQEDVQLSASPTNSVSGTNGPVNPFYQTTQFNYAVKHNPMAFFADTAVQNVYPLSQLFSDLGNNTVGRYNWITPNQYNDAHTSLNGGFTYQGIHYTGDSANIAQGDNFLSQIIPQIMASPVYQNNGVIIIWWDESEGGDDTNRAIPEIIISPNAKGNAYASPVPMNHSSDIKTMSEIFRLPLLNNPIPVTETNSENGYNHVATVNDLSDLFVPGAIPPAPQFAVTRSRVVVDPQTHHAFQLAFVQNAGVSPAPAPVFLVLDNLSSNATVVNAAGATSELAPLGSPFVTVRIGGDELLRPSETRVVPLEFLDPSGEGIDYDTRVLSVTPAP